MSSIYRIHGSRFLRKYTAVDKSSCYAYMADVRKIANSLCKVPWEMVRGDVAATNTIHTEEGLDWNAPERDRFDAAEWCGEHSEGYHRAFAQAACYAFKLPDSAVGTAIEKIRVNVTSDPYNPYGARIAAMTSDNLDIPMDCTTVREGEVFRAPDAQGLGAAPRIFVRNEKTGNETWYSNNEIVELVPSEALAAKKYLLVFVCLENYNRGRDGWIEGSSYIDNDVELTLAAACSDLVADELNDLGCADSSGWQILKDGFLPPRAVTKAGEGGGSVVCETGVRFMTTMNDGTDCAGKNVSHEVGGMIANEDGTKFWKDGYGINAVFPHPIEQVFDVTCDWAKVYLDDVSHWQTDQIIAVSGQGADCLFPEIGVGMCESGKSQSSYKYTGLNSSLVSAANSYGITAVYVKARASNPSGYNYPLDVYIFTKGGGSLQPVGTLTWNFQHSEARSFSGNTSYSFDSSLKVDFAVPYFTTPYVYQFGNPVSAVNGVALLRVASGKITEVGGMAGTSFPSAGIPFVGSVSSIHAAVLDSTSTSLRFVVSGELTSVNGVACKNCAYVEVSSSGVVSVSRPYFDAGLDVDDGSSLDVVRMGTDKWVVAFSGAATYDDVEYHGVVIIGVSGVDPNGSQNKKSATLADDAHCIVCGGYGIGSGLVVPYGERMYTGSYSGYRTQVEDASPAEIVNGLRHLFARFERGDMVAPPESGTASYQSFAGRNGRRCGVAFSLYVGTDNLAVPTANGGTTNKPVKFFGLGSSALVVPFSHNGSEKYSKLRLDWSRCGVFMSNEARVNVWFKAGHLSDEYPSCSNPALYTASAKTVDGWSLVGTFKPAGGSTADFDFDSQSYRYGSFLLTAFVDVSGIKATDDLQQFYGLGKMTHNLVNISTGQNRDVAFPDEEREFIPDMELVY